MAKKDRKEKGVTKKTIAVGSGKQIDGANAYNGLYGQAGKRLSKLERKVAIVTGAGRGVGAATARMLAADGAWVVVNDLDEAEAGQVAGAIEEAGGRAAAFTGNVTDDDFPDRLVAFALDAFGGIDIIVNNAGYIWNSAMHNHTDEQWQAMLDVHVTAPFRILRSFAAWLRPKAREEVEQSGRATCRKVVNISSVSGTTGSATQVAYSAGKAAVVGLTKTLAKEWGRYNVTVNCVAFGHIETRLTQPYAQAPPTIDVAGRQFRVGLSESQIEATERMSPLGRAGRPEDAAGA
ncbi:MAG: SDR family NAD(P)-dependent oxidoreductase, partial [Gammaproteobacteria bacterium]|nr:SDR family NAD(P)-dependent oxidoreductase [Gammaproteobacteria bacterium]